MERKAKNGESGVVLIVCLIILLMLSLIGIASITTSNSEIQVAGNEVKSTGAFYAAEAGLEKATALVVSSYENTGGPPSPLPTALENLNNFKYYYAVTDLGPAAARTLSYGSYNGLNALVKSFEITSQGVDNNLESGVQIEMSIDDALIPLFQFGVFYENVLEIAPSSDIIFTGRIHTNSDAYLVAGTNLYMDRITSAGNIVKGTPPAAGIDADGNIFIRDAGGTYQNMRNADGTFLDSNDPGWVSSSSSRWGATVEDSDHGITDLYMPVSGTGNPTDLIDRGAGNSSSYENRAGLKFVDGQALALQGDGTWLDITAILTGDGSIAYGTFFDEREGVNVQTLEVDINALAASGYYPANGIIYSSNPEISGNIVAVRLRNAQQLPAGGIMFATNNPIYTLGDFNTVNKQPAALMADAVTILSNNWNDANSTHGAGSRAATGTTVNAALVTGTTQTGAPGHGYSGGLENLPRLLENWNGVTFNWTGSAAQLWYSRQAVSPWNTNYYNPPVRNWAYDTDFLDPLNMPPGTPQINILMKTSWNQKSLADFSNFIYHLGGEVVVIP